MLSLIVLSVFQYKTYKISKKTEEWYSFVFNDIMGFEQSADSGVHIEDIKLALMGHVKDGYQVKSFDLWHCLEGCCGVFLCFLLYEVPP